MWVRDICLVVLCICAIGLLVRGKLKGSTWGHGFLYQQYGYLQNAVPSLMMLVMVLVDWRPGHHGPAFLTCATCLTLAATWPVWWLTGMVLDLCNGRHPTLTAEDDNWRPDRPEIRLDRSR